MKQPPQQNDYGLNGIFPTLVYNVKRDSNLDSKQQEAEIEDLIKEGLYKNHGNSTSNNSYIFDTKLKELKQFCEEHIKKYVEEVMCIQELDFYITQSWLNVTKPGGYHHVHSHPNSIISGVFYISTEEDDKITFTDPNLKTKEIIKFAELKDFNIWNSETWFFPVNNNELLLFPSCITHQVEPNEKATTDRISLSFNTFVKGTLGEQKHLTELILK